MKVFLAKNIFEANKFCYYFGKLTNFIFITFKRNKYGQVYEFKTTYKDILRFIFGFSFALYIVYDTLATKLKQEKRSIIFEIIILINGKMQTFHMLFVMLQSFINRGEYFKILMAMHWLDNKVG